MKRRRVLVTGSSRGIGHAIAARLAGDGFSVTLHCRRAIDEAEQLRAQILKGGGDAGLLVFDVNDRTAAKAALQDDIERNGAYYGVVCNAGIARDNTFAALTDEDWDSVIRTSLDGLYNV